MTVTPSDALTHSERRLDDPRGWVIYLSHTNPKRLVVFVHGFRGKSVNSWEEFPKGAETRPWWKDSDLLFVGYPSQQDNITGTAYRLRRQLPNFYPQIGRDLLEAGDSWVRPPEDCHYEELLLIGHSLGGVVVRRALCDAAAEWLTELGDDPSAEKPVILDAQTRLFSPASAGFRPGGRLGMLRAGPTWSVVEMMLRRSSAYTDLQPHSPILTETRARTERILEGGHRQHLDALRARIAWANPDDVVLTEHYTTDRSSSSIDDQNHRSVCKPTTRYQTPWEFVETGIVE